MEHELPEVLDGVDEPVSVDELEAVVRRAGQHRRATLVAGAAGLLALGALGGALARGPADDDTRGLASEGQDTAAPSSSGMAMPDLGFDQGLALTPLFRRESNGVAIRAYELDPLRPPPKNPGCSPSPLVQAELSNAAAVGLAVGPLGDGDLPPADPLRVSAVGMFGSMEGEPATWVIVQSGKNVSSVRLKVGNATDAMAPDDGKAVLVVPGTPSSGVAEALGADGAVLASQPLDQARDDIAPPPGCEPVPCEVLPPRPPSAQPDSSSSSSSKAAQEPSVAPAVPDPACGHPACVSGGSEPAMAPPTTYPPDQKPSAGEAKAGTSSSSGPVEGWVCGPPVSPVPAPVPGLTPPPTGTVPFTVAPAPPVTVGRQPTGPVSTAPAPTAAAQTSTSALNAAP